MTSSSVRTRPESPQPDAYSAAGFSLRAALRIFVRTRSLRVIAPFLLAAAAIRIPLGHWTWGDAEVVAAILILLPFIEWTTHVFALHFKPIDVHGRTLDPIVAKFHRKHHRDPKVIKYVLIPRGVLLRLMVFAVPIFYFAAPSRQLAFTGLITSYATLLSYEWTHFLIHSSYQPRHWYYRYIWRAHRLHHYKNERYWFGVTVNLADHVFRTFPAKDAVPTSATARTLGVETV